MSVPRSVNEYASHTTNKNTVSFARQCPPVWSFIFGDSDEGEPWDVVYVFLDAHYMVNKRCAVYHKYLQHLTLGFYSDFVQRQPFICSKSAMKSLEGGRRRGNTENICLSNSCRLRVGGHVSRTYCWEKAHRIAVNVLWVKRPHSINYGGVGVTTIQ